MFCNSCGKEVSDSLKFCAYCGASMNPGVPVEQPAVPVAPAAPVYPTAPVPQAPVYGATAAPTTISFTLNKAMTLGLFALLAALTLMTTLLGWFSLKVEAGDEDLSIKSSAFGVSGVVGWANKSANEQLKSMKDSSWFDEDDMKEFKKEMAPLRTANTTLWIIKILMFLGLITLLAAVYLVVSGHHLGALVAQAGFSLIILAAIIAMIFGFVASSKVDDVAGAIGGMFGGDMKFGGSIWLYSALIVSGLGMALTTIKKSELKGA